MRIGLDPDEVDVLTKVIQVALMERSRVMAAGPSAEDRAILERETRVLEHIRRRLAEAHREEVLDESVEETFPASDPPARSVVRDRRPVDR
jgi:hypothetical protein